MYPLHWSIILWVFISIRTGFTYKSFRKVVKSCLNLYPLSNTTLRGRGYLHIHVLIKNYPTLADDLSMYSSLPSVTSSRLYVGISTILNYPVEGLIVVIQARLTFFKMIAPPGLCCIIDLLYGPISST